MIHIIVFNLVQLAVAVFAFSRGGPPERWIAGLMLVANIATAIRPYDPAVSYAAVDPALLTIDLLLLLGFVGVALIANRFWPMWIAALQLDAVAIHLLRTIDATMVPFAYAWATGQIAYPMLILLAVGTLRSARRRRTTGFERHWSPATWVAGWFARG